MDVPLLPLLSPPPGQSHPSIKPHCAPEHQCFPSQDTNFPAGPWAHIPPPAPWGDPTGPLPPSSPPQHMRLDGTDGAAGSWGTQGHQGTLSGWGGKRGAVAPLLCKGHPLFWGWSLQQRRGVRVAYGMESPKPLGVTLQSGGCACVPPSVGDRCFNICLGWQLLLSQEEAAVPSRKRMMMRRDSWAVKPGGTKHRGHGWGVPWGGGVALAVHQGPPPQGGTSLISPVSPSPWDSSLPPAAGPVNTEGRHHGIPVGVGSILLPPAAPQCFAFD